MLSDSDSDSDVEDLTNNLHNRYTPACAKLIAQFKTAQKYTEEFVPNIPNFMSEYKVKALFFCQYIFLG